MHCGGINMPYHKKSMTKKPKSMKMSYGKKKTKKKKKQVTMNKLGVLCAQKEVLHGERAKISLDLEVLLNNPTSIPEHTEYSVELDKLVGQLAEVNDKIKIIDFLISTTENTNAQTKIRA